MVTVDSKAGVYTMGADRMWRGPVEEFAQSLDAAMADYSPSHGDFFLWASRRAADFLKGSVVTAEPGEGPSDVAPPPAGFADWEEDLHPRGEGGRFARKGRPAGDGHKELLDKHFFRTPSGELTAYSASMTPKDHHTMVLYHNNQANDAARRAAEIMREGAAELKKAGWEVKRVSREDIHDYLMGKDVPDVHAVVSGKRGVDAVMDMERLRGQYKHHTDMENAHISQARIKSGLGAATVTPGGKKPASQHVQQRKPQVREAVAKVEQAASMRTIPEAVRGAARELARRAHERLVARYGQVGAGVVYAAAITTAAALVSPVGLLPGAFVIGMAEIIKTLHSEYFDDAAQFSAAAQSPPAEAVQALSDEEVEAEAGRLVRIMQDSWLMLLRGGA